MTANPGPWLLQDLDRKLTEWFASKPGARRLAREAAGAITAAKDGA
jgi:hypothetical protein